MGLEWVLLRSTKCTWVGGGRVNSQHVMVNNMRQKQVVPPVIRVIIVKLVIILLLIRYLLTVIASVFSLNNIMSNAEHILTLNEYYRVQMF